MSGCPTFSPSGMAPENWREWQERGLRWLQEIVRIDTTNPPGNESVCADWLCAILDEYGVRYDRFENIPGRTNVVARIEAHGNKKGFEPMLLTAHMDVVPHDREKWTQDPFGGDEVDGWIYGRGTVDMKFMLVENLVSFLVLHTAKGQLKRDVILLALADEEAGCEHGARFMIEKHRTSIEARWGLNELGGFPVYAGGKHKIYLVQVAEKGLVWFDIHIPGTPGHGSIVQGDNALSKAASVVSSLQAGVHPHKTTPAAASMIDGIAAQLGAQGMVVKGLKNAATYPLVRKLIPDVEQQNVFRAILHDTANPTMLRAGTKVNVVPSDAILSVDGRTLPGQTTEGFLAPIRAILPEGSRIEVHSEGDPYSVSTNTELYGIIQDVVGAADPGVPVVPYLMSGFSDSKWLGKLGAEVYGFSPVHFPSDVAMTKLVHGHDERIPVDGFRWGMAVHLETVQRFCVES